MGSKTISALDQQSRVIRLLTMFLLAALLLLGHAHYLLATAPSELEAYLPPDINNGGFIRFGERQPHSIYDFAFRVHQQVMRCEEDCAKEFDKNIRNYGWFYTDKYRNQLLNFAASQEGVNRNRIRSVGEWGTYEAAKVVPLSSSSWVVYIDVRERDRIGGKEVRNTVIRYPLIVKHHDVDRDKNPWRLAIDGLHSDPIRIQ